MTKGKISLINKKKLLLVHITLNTENLKHNSDNFINFGAKVTEQIDKRISFSLYLYILMHPVSEQYQHLQHQQDPKFCIKKHKNK